MKLLFDQNLSSKLANRLADRFPGSQQVRLLGLDRADDRVIWDRAKLDGYVVVTQDSDFADLAALFGTPPKVIWLRCGNCPTEVVEELLRSHAREIESFGSDSESDCLEIL